MAWFRCQDFEKLQSFIAIFIGFFFYCVFQRVWVNCCIWREGFRERDSSSCAREVNIHFFYVELSRNKASEFCA